MVEIDAKHVERLAAQGLTMQQIADSIGVHRATLYRSKNKDSDVCDAIKRGRAKGLADVTNALYESATSGNVTAQIFYLKNRDPEKWKDRRDVSMDASVRHSNAEELTDAELADIAARSRRGITKEKKGKTKAASVH